MGTENIGRTICKNNKVGSGITYELPTWRVVQKMSRFGSGITYRYELPTWRVVHKMLILLNLDPELPVNYLRGGWYMVVQQIILFGPGTTYVRGGWWR